MTPFALSLWNKEIKLKVISVLEMNDREHGRKCLPPNRPDIGFLQVQLVTKYHKRVRLIYEQLE
jgi:hypothetical protein